MTDSTVFLNGVERDLHPLTFSSGILLGRSAAMRELHGALEAIRYSSLPVLIEGPSGSGKRALARAVHDRSERHAEPFASVNVAALGRDYSARLFGRVELPVRLARVGAGSLVVYDVADLGRTSQLILEELLETGEYPVANGRRREKLQARLLCITSADLSALVARGRFRSDLLHRMGAIRLALPPLVERREDIPDLVPFLLTGIADKGLQQSRFLPEAIYALQAYHWPGNIRELDSVLRTLCILTAGRPVDAGLVQHVLDRQGSRAPPSLPSRAPPVPLAESVARHLDAYFSAHDDVLPPNGLYDRILAEVERPLIRKCLAACKGNQIRAADLLGLNRNTLRKKIRDLGLTAGRTPHGRETVEEGPAAE